MGSMAQGPSSSATNMIEAHFVPLSETSSEYPFEQLINTILTSGDDQQQGNDRELGPPRKKQRISETEAVSTFETNNLTVWSTRVRLGDASINSSFRSNLSKISTRPLPVRLAIYEPPKPARRRKSKANAGPPTFDISLQDVCNNRQIIGVLKLPQSSPEITELLTKALKLAPRLPKTVKTYEGFIQALQEMTGSLQLFLSFDSVSESLVIDLKILWESGKSVLDGPKMTLKRTTDLFDHLARTGATFWSPQDFYESVHVPRPESDVWPQLTSDVLDCKLYPFQTRTVQFMLRREGATFKNGRIVTDTSAPGISGDLMYQDWQANLSASDDINGSCDKNQVSRVFGVFKDKEGGIPNIITPKGGLLAEEMGLGKTVEMVTLMCLHKRPKEDMQSGLIHDAYSDKQVIPSAATLIITPTHLHKQWEDELSLHAPHLRVTTYDGVASQKHKTRTSKELATDYDVVLTTYSTLAREIWYADAKPAKELRHARKYSPPTSALVDISWWRICLDEAQQVENGLSNTAKVARLIPRINAWTVSGTPFKSHVTDLFGILTFLRFEPFCDRAIWARVDKPTFKAIFGTIAIRHTKDKVRKELRLPPQKRVVVTIPFLAIEEQMYAQTFEQMCRDCGLNDDGSPSSDTWDPTDQMTVDKMRSWLRRLRQLCLHPQVGTKNQRVLGSSRGAPLRTVADVMTIMIENNENLLRSAEREIIDARIKQGHVQAFAKNNPKRSLISLTTYQSALKLVTPVVEECRVAYKKAASKTDAGLSDGKKDPVAQEKRVKEQQKAAVNLKKALELQHQALFFIATANFQTKDNEELTIKDSEDYKKLEALEMEFYDAAKACRMEMLSESREKAEKSMDIVKKLKQAKLPNDLASPDDMGGIENIKIMDQLDTVLKVLNGQASQIVKLRTKVCDIIFKSLVDTDGTEEQTGEEYEDSTKEQDELYVLVLALRTFIADRAGVLSGEVNLLTSHEATMALKAANDKFDGPKGPAPELLKECLKDWPDLRASEKIGSLRGIIGQLRNLLTTLEWQYGQSETQVGRTRSEAEAKIVEEQMKYLQSINSAQAKALQILEKEIDEIRSCMNSRLEFYRELQRISDMVQPYKEQSDEVFDSFSYSLYQKQEKDAEGKLSQLKTKKRFFEHLSNEADQQEQKLCVICQDSFQSGVLTVCGHQYCKECIRQWWSAHRTCPVCKLNLRLVDFHDITYKPQQITATEEHNGDSPTKRRDSTSTTNSANPGASSSSNPTASIYSQISTKTLNDIKSIDLPTSYGTKLDTFGRHIIWLRSIDPGAKSIFFSQFSEFLDVLADALRTFKIGFTRITDRQGIDKFRRDPAVECFLLDAKSDSSGLNLVSATHVFLCEPLVNPAIELQAIARVHRIGQMRATTVWMSLVQDSVEEAVYNLSVSRRLEHIARQVEDNRHIDERQTVERLSDEQAENSGNEQQSESALDKANSAALQSVPVTKLIAKGGRGKTSGGEIVGQQDLWACLFSKTLAGTRANASVRAEMGRHERAEAAEARLTLAERSATGGASRG
ncbi:hypothetical protein BT63DRAFT_481872 [Microthyrium microscopicum]|uniref:RING-type domain-containing protein n=1 Tax=Microthyrium microscopicum TaxID=703497 RepID=A0A6A6U1R9_9PEZI|nr:hypothetical protein BT63DRAFT_481872 [Microthyrium microscopicum]